MDRFETGTDDFRIELADDGVAHVILGHTGHMPSLSAAGHRAIADIWPTLDEDPSVRVILIRSLGKGFCAGGTPEVVDELLQSNTARLRILREARALVQNILDCDKPLVAAVNGAAAGAGLALALLADISVAARTAKLVDGHTKLGVAAGDHAALIWPLLCGIAKAKYYLLLCESLTGEEAERIGLISRCVETEDVEADALDIAHRLASGSPIALAHTKRSLNHWLRAAWPIFEHSLTLEIMGFGHDDAREGSAAMRERRAPRFRAD